MPNAMIVPSSEELLTRCKNIVPDWALHPLLIGLAGSLAHGTYLPPEDEHSTDDIDLFTVVVQPMEYYLGVTARHGAREDFNTNGSHVDVTGHDVRKFVALLGKGNPNVHSWLWTPMPLLMTPVGKLLVDARESLLSQRVFPALIGYATSQLKKMWQGSTQGYMGAKRKELLRRYGYDIKDASHCIRLLHMGIHLARRGEVLVRLPAEAIDDIRAIKRGEWTAHQVEREAERLLTEFRLSEWRSLLPKEVPSAVLDDLSSRVILAARYEHGPFY